MARSANLQNLLKYNFSLISLNETQQTYAEVQTGLHEEYSNLRVVELSVQVFM